MSFLLENFFWIKIISAAISLIFLIGIIWLAVRIDYFSGKRTYGLEVLQSSGNVYRKKTLKIWKEILKKVASSNPMLWKEAVKEADAILNEVLKVSGYRGKNIEERFLQVTSAQVSNIEELKLLRSQLMPLVMDENSFLELSRVKEILRSYRQAFRQFGMMEE